MDLFVFAVFGVADVRNETGQSPSLRDGVGKSGGIFVPQTPLKWAPLAGSCLKGDVQDRVSKGGQKRPTSSLRLWSVSFDKPRAGFRGRSCGAQNEASGWKPRAQKKLRKSALKLLKQLARVNLCAALKQESEADDSR
jgi:hypothetical protein